jgi:hypothetical protein
MTVSTYFGGWKHRGRRFFRALLLTAILACTLSSVAPTAQAGVLWAGLGNPIAYNYFGVGVYGASTLVYSPYYYYFSGYPYYGYARDYTYFYGYSPFYAAPWVWGFWDPPASPTPSTTITYNEVFTGLDSGGEAIGLQGLQVQSSSVFGDLDNTEYAGTVTHTTFSQLSSLVDPTNLSNLDLLLGQAIRDHGNDSVDVVSYSVPIDQVAQPAPEPASFCFLLGGGLLLAGRRWKRRKTAPK